MSYNLFLLYLFIYSGNKEAVIKVGNCYHDGDGVKKDGKEAFKYYMLAVDIFLYIFMIPSHKI